MSPLATSLRFLQTQSDARLAELSRGGHELAFEALVRRYRRELFAYCRRLTRGGASAEDVLQQALLQAWVAISRDTEIRDVRAWLYRIVHNVAVSNLRRASNEDVGLVGTAGVGGPDADFERRLAAREALAGLATLPELQRQVMLSTALEGRSHEEIAALLGLTHGAVRGLIYRARVALRAAAAAVIPGPLVAWAARQELRGAAGSSGFAEAVAGSGTAGLGGLVVKGSAVVLTAGALATAAGLAPIHLVRHGHRHASARPLLAARPDARSSGALTGTAVAGGPAAVRVSFTSRSSGSGATGSSTGRARPVAAPSRGHAQPPAKSGGHRSAGGPPGGSGSPGNSGGHDGGSSGGTTRAGSGAPGGGSSGGPDGGSSGGGDGGSSGGREVSGGQGGETSGGSPGGGDASGGNGGDTSSGSPGGPDGGSSLGSDGGDLAQSAGTGGGDHSSGGSDGGPAPGPGGD